MSESVNTFKFKASILFAIISFLVVIIAGFLRDVRFITIIWRSLLAFFIAGGISYLIIFILEFKGIINFDAKDAEAKIAEIKEKKPKDASKDDKKPKEETAKAEEKNEGETAENEEGGGFKPLNADNLQRIAS